MRKGQLTDEQRGEIAIAALQGKEPVSEVCNRYGISDVTYYRIKDQALAVLPDVLKYKGKKSSRESHLEKEVNDLKELVADQAVAIQILKKNRSHL